MAAGESQGFGILIVLVGVIVSVAYLFSGDYLISAVFFFLLVVAPIAWRIKNVKEEQDRVVRENRRGQELYSLYRSFSVEQILDSNMDHGDKEYLLLSIHGCSYDDAVKYRRQQKLISRYQTLSPEDIILNGDIEDGDRIYLLQKVHKYSSDEVEELFNTVRKEAKKAKLNMVKGRIAGKIKEFYGRVSSDEERAPISDKVKMYVWQRDGGKCVKCGSQEKLEYDHIIPFSKGGSNSERNIQILCEKCNREKRDNIV
ncbi:MAG: HNH endonuclease [Candidatus Omnitrophota bacterium]